LKTYICFFSYTLTAPIASPPATMLQVATAFFHSWLTRPIATCLFDSIEKRCSYFETVYSYLLTVPSTSVEAERAVGIRTTELRSRLSQHFVFPALLLSSSYSKSRLLYRLFLVCFT